MPPVLGSVEPGERTEFGRSHRVKTSRGRARTSRPASDIARIGLVAVEERHPELIESFRTAVLEPRRAVVIALIERGIERGDLRADLDPVAVLDFIAGSDLARALAGLDTGPRWRSKAFEIWWGTSATQRLWCPRKRAEESR
jgi:hypothetical protein